MFALFIAGFVLMLLGKAGTYFADKRAREMLRKHGVTAYFMLIFDIVWPAVTLVGAFLSLLGGVGFLVFC